MWGIGLCGTQGGRGSLRHRRGIRIGGSSLRNRTFDTYRVGVIEAQPEGVGRVGQIGGGVSLTLRGHVRGRGYSEQNMYAWYTMDDEEHIV